jgi:hypothetical protein
MIDLGTEYTKIHPRRRVQMRMLCWLTTSVLLHTSFSGHHGKTATVEEELNDFVLRNSKKVLMTIRKILTRSHW